MISDAFMLSEMDDVSAAAAMAGTHQGMTDPSKAVEQLRSTCLSMLCAAMQWDLFRCANLALSVHGPCVICHVDTMLGTLMIPAVGRCATLMCGQARTYSDASLTNAA